MKENYYFFNINAPNNATDNYKFLTQFEDFIILNDSKTIIVGGDFITVININIDKKNGNINTNKRNRDKINNILQNNDIK